MELHDHATSTNQAKVVQIGHVIILQTLSPMVVHALIFTPRHTGRAFATKERSQKVGGAVQKTYGDLKENVKDELKKQR